MGNNFAIHGLGDEAAHERRDVEFRQFGTGERPDKDELVETNIPKTAETHSINKLPDVSKFQNDRSRYFVAVRVEISPSSFETTYHYNSRDAFKCNAAHYNTLVTDKLDY